MVTSTKPTADTSHVSDIPSLAIHPSIPVIDISKFDDASARTAFLKDLDEALKVGFFAVVNPKIDDNTFAAGYKAFNQFFALPLEAKKTIHRPDLNGQRGFVPGETALGKSAADNKEYVHIGRTGNIWPTQMDLEGPAWHLYTTMTELGKPLLKAISLLMGESENFLLDATEKGENLMRALHYYKNPKDNLWAARHTDIDLLTILPYASEEGLQVKLNGQWVPIVVPKNALVVNVGDFLEALSNGRWASCKHRVMSTKPDADRESIVFFIHPTGETSVGPKDKENARYPQGTRNDYLLLRLFSLKLLPRETAKSVIDGEFIKRIQTMVENQTAAKSVQRWYKGFQRSLGEFNKRSVI